MNKEFSTNAVIALIGDVMNTWDLCRFVTAALAKKCRILVLDCSRDRTLFSSVFGVTEQLMASFQNVDYTQDIAYFYKCQIEYDVIFVYSGADVLMPEVMEICGLYLFCYGIVRRSYEDICSAISLCLQKKKVCKIICRKEKIDESTDRLLHLLRTKEVYMIPKNTGDYTALEKVEYGYFDLGELSAGLTSFILDMEERVLGTGDKK